jgi:hypothetical protein
MSFALSPSTHPDRDRVAKMISALAVVLGEPLTPERMEGYLGALADVPAEALKAGIRRASQHATWFPKPAEIRHHVDSALREQERYAMAESASHAATAGPPAPHCTRCDDTGWELTSERAGLRSVGVTRCLCYRANPVLARQRVPTYSKGERS